MDQEYLELKIDGILPHDFRAGELAQIISSLEELIFEVVKIERPSITKDDLRIGVFSLESNSTDIDFVSLLPELSVPAFAKVTEIVKTNSYLNLSNKALEPLREIHKITSQYNKDAQFIIHNGKVTKSSSLLHETVIPKHQKIQTSATIFGRVIRVGGSQPKVAIERTSGKTNYCSVISEKLARELGGHLYEWVGVFGTATLDPDDLTIEDFRVEGLTNYSGNLSILDTIEELKGIAGKYYEDISDIESYIENLRG